MSLLQQNKKKRIHVSKNRKKSWGKYCDITDVEDFLEKKRLEERTGGLIAEKKDEELFVIDDTKVLRERKLKNTHTEKVKQGKKELRDLKCHQILNAYSKVPAINLRNKPLASKMKKKMFEMEEKKWKKSSFSSSRSSSNRKSSSSPEFRDLWAEKEEKEPPLFNPDIEDLINYKDEVTRKRPVKIPDHRYQKPSLLPAVEVPHPGASYNPSYPEHQDLLSQAVLIEQKKLKDELHLKRILYDMFPSKENAPTEATYLQEMSQGLFDEDEVESTLTENNILFANPAVTDENRKSKSKRRREKLLKHQAQKRVLEKAKNRKLNDIYRLKQIKAEIMKDDIRTAKRIAEKQQREISKMYKPRTLSRFKFEPNDLEVNLSEDLSESMRVLKVEGNLFEDRYKSLQKRNIIEPRIRHSRKRKYKLKVQVKRSHRDFQ